MLVTASPAWVLNSDLDAAVDGYELNGVRWSGPESFELSKVTPVWDFPASSTTTDALGSGISWALHPDFCEHMLPHFPEEGANSGLLKPSFMSCDDLHDAVANGFETWAVNHPRISFTDMTHACAQAGATVGDECEHAEMLIYANTDPDLELSEDRAAYVRLELVPGCKPLSTEGVQHGSICVRAAALAVTATGLCWYLDSTFCHRSGGKIGLCERSVARLEARLCSDACRQACSSRSARRSSRAGHGFFHSLDAGSVLALRLLGVVILLLATALLLHLVYEIARELRRGILDNPRAAGWQE